MGYTGLGERYTTGGSSRGQTYFAHDNGALLTERSKAGLTFDAYRRGSIHSIQSLEFGTIYPSRDELGSVLAEQGGGGEAVYTAFGETIVNTLNSSDRARYASDSPQ